VKNEKRFRRFRSSQRRAVSDARFAAILASATLVFIVIGVAFSSLSANELDQIRALQGQLAAGASTVGSTSTSATSTTAASAAVAPTVRHLTLVAEDAKITIATNVTYDAWTFNGTVPAPNIMINQGDTVFFKLINNFTSMAHSIDFHAAEIDWATAYATVAPGQTKSFNFTANYPGVFMYHCGTPPVLEHISNGMYGAIIVNPSTPWPAAPGGTYVLIQNEWYLNDKPGADGAFAGNYTKMVAATPDYVAFNGKAAQYQKAPLQVQPSQLVRLYVLNVGPSHWSAFHVIGALMDTVFIDGNPLNVMRGLQTLNIPPSGGAVVDMYFRDPGGLNPFVTHAFADESKGAVGVFSVAGGSHATASTVSTSSGAKAGLAIQILKNSGVDTTSPGYSPAVVHLVIGVNNTVTWTNFDSIPHTVTSTTNAFDSGNINAGESFTYTFATAGTYQYYCVYHTWMKGTVVVLAKAG
jgi:nitrite reductase (NO-forming)